METPKNRDPNKITINGQDFQKVGNMNSEMTGVQHFPKKYDLYQDKENGALMGEIPAHYLNTRPPDVLSAHKHLEECKEKAKKLDIDLRKLSSEEIKELLENPGVKLFGMFSCWGNNESGPSVEGEIKVVHSSKTDDFLICPPKGLGVVTKSKSTFYQNASEIKEYKEYKEFVETLNPINFDSGDFSAETWWPVEVAKKENSIVFRGQFLQDEYDGIEGGYGRNGMEFVFQFSFYEIPEGYKELMEKKESGE